MDVFKPVPWTERDEGERRIALRMVALASPLIVAWIVAAPLVYVFLTKSAEAKVRTLDYPWAALHTHIAPCRAWFDVGFTVSYQTPNGRTQDGKLCRGICDDDWAWHPQ